MNRKELRDAIKYGFGSAIEFLRSVDNCEEYLDIIYDFSIHNYAFDSQCENSRARYLWDLILASGHVTSLQERIMETLGNYDVSIYHYQIYQLGVLFAQESKYNQIELMKKHFRYHNEYGSFLGEDEIIELTEKDGIVFVAKAICERLEKDENYDGEYFFINDIVSRFGREKIDFLLKDLLESNERFRNYYYNSLNRTPNKVCRSRDSYEVLKSKLKDFKYNRIRPWSRFASEEELEEVALDINKSSDLELVAKLMHAYYKREYKGEFNRIINFLDDKRYELSESAVHVLKWKQDDLIRQKAIELICNSDNWYEYIPLLFKNYKKGDYRLLVELCEKKYDEFEWHSIQLVMNELFKLHRNVECHDLYIKLYRNNRCTICRKDMFKYMLRDGFSNVKILSEAMWDANLEIRNLVNTGY